MHEILPDGPWLGRVDPTFLARTYPAWAGNLASAEDAARAFRRHGFPELAALAPGLDFDPVYYAEANPAWAGTHEIERYRHWLMEGMADGRPGSAAGHLRKLGLALDAYPDAFPWRHYARLRPEAAAHRWAALDDFCAGGFGAVIGGLRFEVDAAPFLLAVGRMFSTKDDQLAIYAFELARTLSPLSSVSEQHLADAYLRQGLWRPALDLYRGIVGAGEENAWTLRNLARCASRLEEWPALLADVETARPRLAGGPLWRETACDTLEAVFGGQVRRAYGLMADDRYAEADALLLQAVADLADLTGRLIAPPARHPQAAGSGHVLFLANTDDPDSAHRRIHTKLALLDRLGLTHRVVPFGAPDNFIAELPRASAVILFRVPALPGVLRGVVAARQVGLPIYYDTDQVLPDPETAPSQESYRGLLTGAVYDELRFAMPLYRAAAGLADFGLAPTGRLAETLRPLVRNRRAFVVRDTFLDAGRTPAGSPGAPVMFLRVPDLMFLDADAGTIGGALLDLMAAQPELVLQISGTLHPDPRFDPFAARIHHLDAGTPPFGYRPHLARAQVNLTIRCATPDHEYQADIAWAEAAEDAIPSVMLLPDGLLPELRDGENVLRAATPAGWAEALARVLDDTALRQRIALQARQDALLARTSAAAARALEFALAQAPRTEKAA